MSQINLLTHHRDIQNWVSAKHGLPAIARERNSLGEIRARLCLSFSKGSAGSDMSPCSWTAWLTELDRQQLALKVSGQGGEFELVDRAAVYRTSPVPLN